MDCDWPPVFSELGVLGLHQGGRCSLWQLLFWGGGAAVLSNVLQGEGESRVGIGVLAPVFPLTPLSVTFWACPPDEDGGNGGLIWLFDFSELEKPKPSMLNYKDNTIIHNSGENNYYGSSYSLTRLFSFLYIHFVHMQTFKNYLQSQLMHNFISCFSQCITSIFMLLQSHYKNNFTNAYFTERIYNNLI